ncbi:hypothetical protein [Clostridium sp. LIBA-8841]|uniref:hypothetical protein n=1 Tax=Clostridium sp. LIBA-8841 TaxID=2987530 RepID=UPI002AC6D7B9|nr:hypothetical protein [Clostridium sp. LIBA-8841]MDZ5254904.1 hypothetical protein [Clostridium sp. LIBA-8841]
MLCERCYKNNATIKLVKDTDGNKECIMLCDKCAVEIVSSSLEDDDISLEEFLMDLNNYIDCINEIIEAEEFICVNCGTEYMDFQEHKLLGCEKCYESFRKNIGFLLDSEEANVKHIGKQPKRIKKNLKKIEILNLEEKLKINILKEEYENAIITKEKIHDLKKIVEEDSNNDSMD